MTLIPVKMVPLNADIQTGSGIKAIGLVYRWKHLCCMPLARCGTLPFKPGFAGLLGPGKVKPAHALFGIETEIASIPNCRFLNYVIGFSPKFLAT